MPWVTATAALSGFRPVAERVGRIVGDYVDSGHGQVCILAQLPDHVVQVRCLMFSHFLSPIHAQNNLVAEPVTADVHRYGNHESDQRAVLPSDHPSQNHQECCQCGQEDYCFDLVHMV